MARAKPRASFERRVTSIAVCIVVFFLLVAVFVSFRSSSSSSSSSSASSSEKSFHKKISTSPPPTPPTPAPTKQKDPEKWAVVQLFDISSDDSVPGILATNHVLRQQGDLVPTINYTLTHVVLVVDSKKNQEDNADEEYDCEDAKIQFRVGILARTQIIFINLREVFPQFDEMRKNEAFAKWDLKHLYKLSVFNFLLYDRVVWLDSDIIVLNSLLGLFHRAETLNDKLVLVEPNICFNTGVLVVKPTHNLLDDLLDFAVTETDSENWRAVCVWNGKMEHGDDASLIKAYFQGQKNTLDFFLPEYHFTLHLSGSNNQLAYAPQAHESAAARWVLKEKIGQIHAVHILSPELSWVGVWSDKAAYRSFMRDPLVGSGVAAIVKKFFNNVVLRAHAICTDKDKQPPSETRCETAVLRARMDPWCKQERLPPGFESAKVLLLDSDVEMWKS